MLWGTTTITCCHSGIILNTVIIQGFFFLIHTFIKKLWMNSHRHILIYDTFSIIQTIKIFTIQNWEINRTKPCKKRVFFQNCFEYTLLQPVKVNKARIWILEHMFSETLFKVQYNCPACWHRASSVQYHEEQRLGYDSKSAHLLLEVNTTNYEYA